MMSKDETVGTCSWCGVTAVCSAITEEDGAGMGSTILTCGACEREPNPAPAVTHEHLRLFTPTQTMRGQMMLG